MQALKLLNKLSRHSWILIAVIFPAIAIAAPPKELTLNDAILLGLRYNPSIRNAEIQRVLDKFNLRLAENNYEVNYALTGAATYNNTVASGQHSESANYSLTPEATLKQSPYGTTFSLSAHNPLTKNAGSAAYYNPGIILNVTQPLLRGFGKAVNLAPLYNAQDTELLNHLNLKNTVINNIDTIIQNYTTLVQVQNALETRELALKNTIETRDHYRALIKAGRRAPADLVQFQSNVINQQFALQQQKMDLQTARFNLLNNLGIDPNTPIIAPKSVTLPELKIPSLADSIQTALLNNIAYQQALINFRITKRGLIIAKNQQRWQLDLIGKGTVGGGSGGAPNSGLASLSNGQNTSSQVGLQLSVPIDDMSRKQQLVQAKVQLEQAKISLDALKQQTITTVIITYNDLIAQKQQITQAQEGVRLARENLHIAYAKLKYGKITPFEVSSLQSDYIDNQIQLITAQETYVNNVANLDQTLGTTLDRWNIHLRE